MLLGTKLLDLLLSVQTKGELTAAAVQAVNVAGQPLELTRELKALRVRLLGNPQGLEGEALQAWRKQQALARIDHELAVVKEGHDACQRREAQEDDARLAAARLPAEAVLEKIVRYERMLERQIERGLGMLEKRRKVQSREVQGPKSGKDGTNGTERTDGTDGNLQNEAKGSGGSQIGDFRFQSGETAPLEHGREEGERPQRFREDKDEERAGSETGAPVKGEGGVLRNEAKREGGTPIQEAEEVSKMGSEKWEGVELRNEAKGGGEFQIGDFRFQKEEEGEKNDGGQSPMSETPLTPARSPDPIKGEEGATGTAL